jgi:Ser-tRNA(Ala) deacylase AlaX
LITNTHTHTKQYLMKRLQLQKRHLLMSYAKVIMVFLLSSWLLPANAQSSGQRNKMEEYSSIFSILNGRTAIISNTDITYYTGDFYPEIKGKIRSIGNTEIIYYTGDFYPEIRGKVKSVGKSSITYYTGDFYPEIKGKLKTVGDTNITYYTGDFYPEIKGKLKSVGNADITYYTGDFYPELKGKVKSVKGNFPESMLFNFPELGIVN